MSYILDALKRAESERNLGEVPNLHAQQPTFAAPPEAKASFRSTWWWIALAALVIVMIALAWIKPWQPAPVQSQPVSAKAPAPPPPPPPPQAAATVAAPPALAPSAGAGNSAVTEAPPEEAPARPVKQKAPPPKEPPEKNAAKATQPKPDKNPKAAHAAAPSAEEKVTALRDLPDNIQREIPELTISGYIYSTNKADRTVLINKQLRHEGDQVAPDLTLEKLTPSGMVLNYKGYRYRASY